MLVIIYCSLDISRSRFLLAATDSRRLFLRIWRTCRFCFPTVCRTRVQIVPQLALRLSSLLYIIRDSYPALFLFLTPSLHVNPQRFFLHSPCEVLTECGLSFQVLEVIAWFPVDIYGFDVLVGIEVVHGIGSLTFESGVELAHLGEVNLVAFRHLLSHGFGNCGDDSLVVSLTEGGAMEGDVVQEFVYRFYREKMILTSMPLRLLTLLP